MDIMFNWLLNLIHVFAMFSTWLTTKMDIINMSPLALFTFAGITTLIAIHIVKLFV